MAGAHPGCSASGAHPASGVSPRDAVTLAIVALCAVVPLAFVLSIALLRGYTISLHMRRPDSAWHRRRRRDER